MSRQWTAQREQTGGGGERSTTTVAVVQTAVPWHRRLSLSCLRGKDGGKDDGALASLAVPCLLACLHNTMTTVARRTVPQYCWPCLACSCNGQGDGDVPCCGQAADDTTGGRGRKEVSRRRTTG